MKAELGEEPLLTIVTTLPLTETRSQGFCAGHWWLSCSWHRGTWRQLGSSFLYEVQKEGGQRTKLIFMTYVEEKLASVDDQRLSPHGFIPRDGTAHKYRYFGCSFGCTNYSNCVVIYCYLLFARLQLILWRYIRLTTMEQNIVGWEQWRCWDSVPWPNTQQLEHEG